ncbi:UNVERIFIED_CONTAM: hypothetical protein Slati_2802200 [Sesamum latifolium]|uniref:Uncharacterized protein n=1 Tax=Sesamum latifolium TaxID=2727402 RepID=A0AAW2V9Y7_9LAMI
MGLQVVPSDSEALAKINAFDEEVNMTIEDLVNSSYLKERIELLKTEVEKAGSTPDEDSKSNIQALQAEIKQTITEAISFPELKEKYEKLVAEILETTKPSVGSDGSSGDENTEDSQVNVNLEANRSFV